ncbi:HSPB (heat shock 27kDa) associated protein 1 L homeolog [Xenopus laevis]|uniref:HSPB (Heat shock 27kDa) associated protein 1 L homeolog n=1 Tax=Xenopus laevis TaxID=8355 RepID=A4QNS2_XENLA|nr:HSPB (heat shock 27kDa) associated protein 1 L homeolog [Xenopus laevis]AAI39495.1 LOC733353 protein [Xenopus laevis]
MEPAQEGERGQLPKPFTPQQTRDLILNLTQPTVFNHMVSDWPASAWNVDYLSSVLRDNLLCFRIGRKVLNTEPQFETHCSYISGTLGQFQKWVGGTSQDDWGSFSDYDHSEYWAYADYKYLAVVFKDQAEMLQDVVWADFGFPGRDGKESSLWVGSFGANTPCHVDSYGCNLVLQVEGRKTWHLFPPEDTPYMYPTRIPYEESSIFSKVNIVKPDQSRFPLFSRASPHVVTLHPGQVLFVPQHWWHYVQSVDDITVSINSWIELDSDHEFRVQEAITRTLVCLFKSVDPRSTLDWLNPTEDEVPSHQTNMQYLSRSVAAYAEHHKQEQQSSDSCPGNSGPKKRKTGKDAKAAEDVSLPSAPFGPFLTPVLPIPKGTNLGRVENSLADKQQNASTEIQPHPMVKAYDSSPGQSNSGRIISSDEVMDCLVDPRVIQLVTELLLQRHNP